MEYNSVAEVVAQMRMPSCQKSGVMSVSRVNADFCYFADQVEAAWKSEVRRFFPSSQTCHECGYVNKAVRDVHIRKWICPKCGAVHDRDRNAAMNILREGTSSLGRESVRPTSERRTA